MSTLKLAVVSDSHDNTGNIEKIAAFANEKECDYLLHLGDITTPSSLQKLESFKGIVQAVFGNCDGNRSGLQQVVNRMGGDIAEGPCRIEIAGNQIVMMHQPFLLDAYVREQSADFIFYGHLHKKEARQQGRTLIMSPGQSCGGSKESGFFILDLRHKKYEYITL